MAPTPHLLCLLALLMAGLAQGLGDSRRAQEPGPRPLELKEVFTLFLIQYNRTYSSPAEYAHRLVIFAHNLAQAQQLQEEDLGTAEFGVTPFSDLTEEEFDQIYGHRRVTGRVPSVDRARSEEREKSVPRTCDWRKAAGVNSPVRDQKNCACCWAMATAGNIEALWAIRSQQSVEVSVQGGLASEKDYPYRGDAKTHRCLARMHKNVAWIQDFIMLQNDEQTIARYLATHGPITVTINKKLLQQYQRGVIKATPKTCNPQHVDHVVLLIGFGKSKAAAGMRAEAPQSHPRRTTPYWILKNSWGASWGEDGYFRLHQGSNTCGITKYPLTARVAQPAKKRPVSCPP
ncbi:cathepsin W isoform X2 [Choloepus didactylus]|uniref:cathepsin W isoform X2 n=1 Tax=Choloepus didactylus TaxID=27675 RepID=UPI0018A0DF0E|nr:cathepsin W isoform X2 [Choloepus didactylus]